MAEPAAFDDPAALPLPLTSLVGREAEIVAVRARLAEDGVRLLTLLGPGGSGKTRLAIEVARRIANEDGAAVAFVDLTAARDAAEVAPALVRALGLPAEGRDPADAVAAELRRREPLLVLDNLEQIPGVAGPVGALLRACPALTVLATSRSPLRLSGEQRWPLEPLPLPDGRGPEEIGASAAVALFVARARLIRPEFALTPEAANEVAEIVRALDGLPLAIELAAARVRLLSPAALLARLTNRLSVLTSNATDLPDRQRTIRETIAWSYERLDEADRRTFRALSVFRGAFALPDAEAIAGPDAAEAAERLVDHSLVVPAGELAGEPRLRMLETIREYAADRLAASGEDTAAAARHAAHYLGVVAAAAPRMLGHAQAGLLDRLNADHANLRAALEWSTAHDPRSAARSAGALYWFWFSQGHFSEARAWLDRALLVDLGDDRATRSWLLAATSAIAWRQGALDRAAALADEALAQASHTGEATTVAFATLVRGGVAFELGDAALGLRRTHDALARYRLLGDSWGIATALNNLGNAALYEGDWRGGARQIEEALELMRQVGDRPQIAIFQTTLGYALHRLGDDARATALLDEALLLQEQVGDPFGAANTLGILGEIALAHGRLAEASGSFAASLGRAQRIDARLLVQENLCGLALVARAAGQDARAVRLLGAAAGIGVPDRDHLSPGMRQAYDRAREELPRKLGRAAFEKEWSVGQRLSVAAAIAEATSPADTSVAAPLPELREPLTPRELDVLRLVAAGKTNAEIGATLFISPFTAKTHVANLLGKLQLENRSAAAGWAAAHGLA